MINIYNSDSLEAMKQFKDNEFDLAIVDPNWGVGADNPTVKPNTVKQKNGKVLNVRQSNYSKKDWDSEPATAEYGNELFRVSKNQIIIGANFFDWIVDKTFKPPRRNKFDSFFKKHPTNWIIWDKMNGDSDQWDCELAWSSIKKDTFIIQHLWSGMMQGSSINGTIQEGNKKLNEKRIHPTQKPIKIYEKLLWIYSDWAKSILDTHLGSGSIAIACHNLGFDLTGYEIDKEYYDAALNRLEWHQRQKRLF